jgi:hypothetical protein
MQRSRLQFALQASPLFGTQHGWSTFRGGKWVLFERGGNRKLALTDIANFEWSCLVDLIDPVPE